MSDPRRPLPPQRRSRSLARLEAEIVQAELACTKWRTRAEGLEAAGQDGRQARAMLSIAEERLARLDRSREVLLRGEVDFPPRSGGMRSERHAAARMLIPSMPALASAGVR
jgi:hypothetical protein